jgi:hypothetical protein
LVSESNKISPNDLRRLFAGDAALRPDCQNIVDIVREGLKGKPKAASDSPSKG